MNYNNSQQAYITISISAHPISTRYMACLDMTIRNFDLVIALNAKAKCSAACRWMAATDSGD